MSANRNQLKRVAMAPLRPPSVVVDDAIPVTTLPSTDEVQTRPNRITQPPAFTDEEEAFFAAGDLDQ